MRISLRTVFVIACAVLLSACGGGSGSSSSTTPASSPVTLAAGSTMVMAANTTVYVPAGTVVKAPNGTTITVSGSSNTIVTQVGAVVSVPASATGPANDMVTTGQASSSLSTSSLAVTSLAGSPTTNLSPVDGTGASAVFWGGGHLAIDNSGNIFLSDRGDLRKVTQSGVVVTLGTQGSWDGVALDPTDNVFGSGNVLSGTFSALLQELSVSSTYQQLFTNWESSATNPFFGFGGIAIDSTGALFLADGANNRIVKFNVGSNTWAVFAGSGTSGNQDGVGTAATFTLSVDPDFAIDGNDNLYVRSGDTVRKIAPDGTVTTIASQLQSSDTIAADRAGNIYTSGSQAIVRIASNGSVVTYPFTATTDAITSLVADSSGSLYVGTRGAGAQIFKITFPNN